MKPIEYGTLTSPAGRVYIDKADLVHDIRTLAIRQLAEAAQVGPTSVAADFTYGASLLHELADAIEGGPERPAGWTVG